MGVFDDHAYGRSAAFSLGVEEELLLVDRETLALAHVSEQVLPRMRVARGGAQHDLYGSLIELTSPISASSAAPVAVLGELRRDLRAAGGTPFAAGIRPDASFGDVRIVPLERYLLASAS